MGTRRLEVQMTAAFSKPNAPRAVSRCERLSALGPPPPWSRPWKLRRWLRAYRAIMAMDISEFGEMLRDAYPKQDIEAMAARKNAMFAKLSKYGGPFVEVVERVQLGPDGRPDESTHSIEVRS